MKSKKILKKILKALKIIQEQNEIIIEKQNEANTPFVFPQPNEIEPVIKPLPYITDPKWPQPSVTFETCVGPGNGCPMTNYVIPPGGTTCSKCKQYVRGMEITCSTSYNINTTLDRSAPIEDKSLLKG